jgi:hypothetical protein
MPAHPIPPPSGGRTGGGPERLQVSLSLILMASILNGLLVSGNVGEEIAV